ncbi:PREDICTED: uncharacterized protein LOC109243631 [Nicotiana attenuata]|uniref:uncharacterized protein LOC109243631 n=1 Tax=Nicotiana attenuata TaxID=49451 RepID=UPI000905BB45|nr:PREDICTED: uncharacterized protein LOC109243631 [Nicotiana attenuata]
MLTISANFASKIARFFGEKIACATHSAGSFKVTPVGSLALTPTFILENAPSLKRTLVLGDLVQGIYIVHKPTIIFTTTDFDSHLIPASLQSINNVTIPAPLQSASNAIIPDPLHSVNSANKTSSSTCNTGLNDAARYDTTSRFSPHSTSTVPVSPTHVSSLPLVTSSPAPASSPPPVTSSPILDPPSSSSPLRRSSRTHTFQYLQDYICYSTPTSPLSTLTNCSIVPNHLEDGTIERFKAQLVLRGDTQLECIDYTDTFSPAFTVIVVVYVDDVRVLGDDRAEISALKSFFGFSISNQGFGALTLLSGIRSASRASGVLITQHKFALDLLCKFACDSNASVSTPLPASIKLTSDSGDLLADHLLYQRLIGKHLLFAVQLLSKFMHSPKTTHYSAALHVLRYIKGNPGQGLFMSNSTSFELQAFCDSNWLLAKIPACLLVGLL